MGAALRILHTADSHIGAGLPVRPRRDGPRRGDDLVTSFVDVLDRAVADDVDLVIHAGDLFNRSKPSSRALAAAGEPLLAVAAGGIPVVIVPGNHERSAIPANLLLSHPNIRIVTRPTTLRFDLGGRRVAVSAWPCLRRDAARRFESALAATGWADEPADLRLLAVHQTFESATCGPGSFRFRSGEDVVERTAVPAAFDYVAAGHVHRHQVLEHPCPDGPAIVYCGSPDRVSFAESDEPKGCVLVEERDGRLMHRFVEHQVRPMSTWPVDVTGLSPDALGERLAAILSDLPPRAIAQIRLSGRSENGTLPGLRFAQMIRRLRPDALVSVSMRAVEFTRSRAASATPRRRSAFDRLDAPPEQIAAASLERIGELPARRGVYALSDGGGRLLYVGKAGNVRGRVRTHLRGHNGANFFAGWGRQIARVETRPSDSDLEARLIEAELVRTLRPPFNRQMRRWTSYCYLAENDRPHGQLAVCRQPVSGGVCFGPFRSRRMAEAARDAAAEHFRLALCANQAGSDRLRPVLAAPGAANLCRRYFDGLCTGPCANRPTRQEYARRLAARRALLGGVDDTALRELEQQVAAARDAGQVDDTAESLARRARTLRLAFEQGAILREAETLLGALLILPGGHGRRKAALLTRDGVRLDTLENDETDARRLLTRWRKLSANAVHPGHPRRLPAAIADALCIAARELRRPGHPCQVIRPGEQESRDTVRLLSQGFRLDPEKHGSTTNAAGSAFV